MKNTPGKWLLLVGGTVVVMAIIVFIVGRGWMANLGSNAFGNVCTRASLESGKVQYEEGTMNLIGMSAERDHLKNIVALWKQEIKKNESQIKKFESEKKTSENQIKNLEKYIKSSCSRVPKTISGGRSGSKPNPLYTTCESKKKELATVQQNVKKAEAALTKEKEQNRKRTTTIKNAEAKMQTLDQQIQNITSYITGYDACKWSISGEVTISGEVFVASISAPTTVAVNTPFTVELGMKNKSGATTNNYTGSVYMWGTNSDNFCYLDGICTWDDVVYPGNSQAYTFVSGEVGVHSFTNWFTIKRAGTYRIYMSYPTYGPPDYYKEDFVNIIVK